MSNTQLTSASGYNTDKMVFGEPIVGSIPDSKPAIVFRRIPISTKNPDGSIGELILPTIPGLFSFGVSENLSQDTGKVNGYTFPICLHTRDGAKPEEKEWVETFNNIVEKCKDHLVDNREEIEKYDLEKSDLKKLNPLYYKRDKGKIVEGAGPTLYAKLIMSKKLGKIVSMFYDELGKDIDPLELIGKYCTCNAAIKIESIFIGNKISLQVKMYEAEVKLVQTGMRRLLSRPNANPRVLVKSVTASGVNDMLDDDDDEDDDSGSIVESEDEEPEVKVEEPPKKKKKVVKKVIRKVKKKTT